MDLEHARAWSAFRDAGLLWWVNRMLHLFGWAIALDVDKPTDTVLRAYPKRVEFKGFTEEAEERGFNRLQAYIQRGFK